jgi:hypothetical protein
VLEGRAGNVAGVLPFGPRSHATPRRRVGDTFTVPGGRVITKWSRELRR